MLDKMLKSHSVWEKLKDADLPIVCYGTGNGADKIFDEFERLGIKISAVMASDGLSGTEASADLKLKVSLTAKMNSAIFTVYYASVLSLNRSLITLKALQQSTKLLYRACRFTETA